MNRFRALFLAVTALALSAVPASAEALLVGNMSENTVSFIDLASGQVLRRIAAGKNGDGLAIAR